MTAEPSPTSLRLNGGDVLLPTGELVTVDVLVEDGRIAALCAPGTRMTADEEVSVGGLTVLPGIIDSHVHLGKDITVPRTAEDVALESAAAAAGGVTSMLVYLLSAVDYELSLPGIVDLITENSLVDIGLHLCICTESQLASIPRYVSEWGITSFKFFMNYRGDEGSNLGLPGNDDGFLFELLRAAAATGATICPHPENVEVIWRLREAAIQGDAEPLSAWYASRPPFVEAEAILRVAMLARAASARLHIVHVSSAESLEAALLARQLHPETTIETCPHYLTLDVDSDLGVLGKVSPPLRHGRDREVLWDAVRTGAVDTIASDHVPRPLSAKSGTIWQASAGFPGVETLLPILLTEQNRRPDLGLAGVVDMVTRIPARSFGLSGRKGEISVGADADFAIVDLGRHHVVDGTQAHSGAGYSVHDGRELIGSVVHTIVRGRFVYRDGELAGNAGSAEYLRRSTTGQHRVGRHATGVGTI